jgi:hypothetical protein
MVGIGVRTSVISLFGCEAMCSIQHRLINPAIGQTQREQSRNAPIAQCQFSRPGAKRQRRNAASESEAGLRLN